MNAAKKQYQLNRLEKYLKHTFYFWAYVDGELFKLTYYDYKNNTKKFQIENTVKLRSFGTLEEVPNIDGFLEDFLHQYPVDEK